MIYMYYVLCHYTELHTESFPVWATNEAHALFKAESIAREKGYKNFWCEI